MSTDDLMREQPPRRVEAEQTSKPDTEAAEAAEVAGAPDAVKQASARRDAVRERMDQVRGRGLLLGVGLEDGLPPAAEIAAALAARGFIVNAPRPSELGWRHTAKRLVNGALNGHLDRIG